MPGALKHAMKHAAPPSKKTQPSFAGEKARSQGPSCALSALQPCAARSRAAAQKPREPRRYRPGVKALKEIRQY